MKKLFFSIFALCMGMCAMAQSSVYVYQKDGKTLEIAVSNLDSISFIVPATGTEYNGHAWVDLGLPSGLRWATCNVGATKPEEYGNYYAWGEIATKSTYDWSTYKYANGSNTTLTKYCNSSSYGKDSFTDALTTLKAADDAATQNWGGNWRMPTIDEWSELKNNCDWIWTDNYNNTNVAGNIVTSKTNGNSIFLPAAGYYISGGQANAGSQGLYWSSSLYTSKPSDAQSVFFDSSIYYKNFSGRKSGFPTRSVSKEGEVMPPCYSISLAETENGTISASTTIAQTGEAVTLNITPNSGYKLKSLSVMCGEKEVEVTNNSFIMPEGEVKITASFAITYGITVIETENGSVIPSTASAVVGEEVSINITPNSSYMLQKLSVKCGKNEIEVIGNSFIMPEGDIEISASFALLEPLSGVFSVSADKTVKFAPGNLQYTQSTQTWSIAVNQYDVIGTDNVTGGTISEENDGNSKSGTALADKIDLFGWSANNTTAPWGISISTSVDYSGDFVDWGKNIGNGSTWRTLTKDEWIYLTIKRSNAADLKGIARIKLSETKYVNGLILLPDNWTDVSGITFNSGLPTSWSVAAYADHQTFTLADWQKLEAAGALFLPAAGYRYGTIMYRVQNDGIYWSATPDNTSANYYFFCSSNNGVFSNYRHFSYAVRLVQDVE